jgi:hypothetical protein
MNPTTLQNLVTEAVNLDREIHELTDRLKVVKGELVAVACARDRETERVGTDGGGWSWTAPGRDGCIARVIMPGRKLRATFDPEVKAHARVLAKFGDAVKRCFIRRTVLAPLDDFRARVETEFPPAVADKLITACETESTPRVEFETTERGTAA